MKLRPTEEQVDAALNMLERLKADLIKKNRELAELPEDQKEEARKKRDVSKMKYFKLRQKLPDDFILDHLRDKIIRMFYNFADLPEKQKPKAEEIFENLKKRYNKLKEKLKK